MFDHDARRMRVGVSIIASWAGKSAGKWWLEFQYFWIDHSFGDGSARFGDSTEIESNAAGIHDTAVGQC